MKRPGMYSFRKSERLRSGKQLDELFKSGKRLNIAPLTCMFLKLPGELETESLVQVAFSVPKRHHKKAVSRNRIKRLMREAYRLNKHSLLEYCERNKTKCIALITYNRGTDIDFQEVQAKIILTLDRLIKALGGSG